ncbi:MAG TPA: hypothetical protein VGH27_18240, partial [Streptosporangiaceae bacterium]
SRPPSTTPSPAITPSSATNRDHAGHQPQHPRPAHPRHKDQLKLSGIVTGEPKLDNDLEKGSWLAFSAPHKAEQIRLNGSGNCYGE